MELKTSGHTDQELQQVAAIHAQQLHLSFLASLGQKTLILMYSTIDLWENSCLITAFENGKITGFVSGTISINGLYKQFLKNDLFSWIFILLPKLSLKNIRRILEVIIYPNKNDGESEALPHSELLTLAVTDQAKGRGVATALYRRLEFFFKEKGETGFRIMVGDELARAQAFYAKMGAEKKSKVQVHKGSDSWIFVQWIS